MEAGKAKVSEDTTWSPFRGNLCTGWHLLTSLQSQCMHTAGLMLLSDQLLLSLCSSNCLKQQNMTWNSPGCQNNRISFCSSYTPSHIYANSDRLANCSSTENSWILKYIKMYLSIQGQKQWNMCASQLQIILFFPEVPLCSMTGPKHKITFKIL